MKDIRCRKWMVLCPLLALLLTACTTTGTSPAVSDPSEQEDEEVVAGTWLKNGSITIAKGLPSVTTLNKPKIFSFIPNLPDEGVWVQINRKEKLLKLMEGEKTLYSSAGQGFEELIPGDYRLLHKQRQAPWYAPITYFVKRRLQVPPEGDRDRFLRGALGNYVLFIDNETPIHSGPIWSEDVGGVKLSESDLARLYYLLEVGSSIKIQ